MKTMKILNKVLLLMLIMTTIGCSTDDLGIIENQNNENTVASKAVGDPVMIIDEEMVFPSKIPLPLTDKIAIINYYLNKYPNFKRWSLTTINVEGPYYFKRYSNDLELEQELFSDGRIEMNFLSSGPAGDDDDDDDENDNLWG